MTAARSAALAAAALLALTSAACDRAKKEEGPKQQRARQGAVARSGEAGVTPMAERVAVLGVLNKRNGIVRDVALRPGQSARWKDMIVRLRACERTAPWEQEQLTGAFIQVDVQRPDEALGRVFSGWVYKESPSLNVVEHPVYDVWVKNCEMTFPAAEPVPGSDGGTTSSRAPNAGGGRSRPSAPAARAEPSPSATPTAPDSNVT